MKKNVLVASLVILGVVQGVCWAGFNCDFEAPAYVSGVRFIGVDDVGVDGWSGNYYWNMVTPDPNYSGYNRVLAGTKSGVISSINEKTRKFADFGQGAEDYMEVSLLFTPETGNQTFKCLMSDFGANNFGFGAIHSGGGLEAFAVFYDNTTINTSPDPLDYYHPLKIWPGATTYRARMIANFTSDQFTVYLKDVSHNTAEVLAGTFTMGGDVSAATVQANGGLKFSSDGGGTYIDGLTAVVPEPITSLLLISGFGMFAAMRRKGSVC